MDLEVLKKKISTFRSEGGRVRKVSDELLMEILHAWENWTGPAKGFYTVVGISQKGMASIIGKAKKLKREGHFPVEDFKEIKISENLPPLSGSPCVGIEIVWDNGKLIRFPQVEVLIDFLKKVAWLKKVVWEIRNKVITFNRRTKVFVCREPTDMRASYDTLFSKAKGVLNQDPFSGHLFLFMNSRRSSIKCLYYDGTGLVILMKRLEKGLFSKINPYYKGELILTAAEFALFFEGADMERRFIDSPKEIKKSAFPLSQELPSVSL